MQNSTTNINHSQPATLPPSGGLRGAAIVVAIDNENAIGRNGDLLCHLPNDLKHFKNITSGHTVVMGRRTFESLPKGALPNRTNIVITSDAAENYPNCIVVRSLEEAFEKAPSDKEIFIIGGGQLYCSSLELTEKLYLTRIHHTFENADTFFPEIDFSEWELMEKEEHKKDEKHKFDYTFETYERKINQ
ncbi:dihydrofolate reductase [Petrimonas sp.]|uniref:dihydrofolate reductase n=1 Tax=Petrimonas sp. TaxID=2023866 RepID=UPI003F50D7C0